MTSQQNDAYPRQIFTSQLIRPVVDPIDTQNLDYPQRNEGGNNFYANAAPIIRPHMSFDQQQPPPPPQQQQQQQQHPLKPSPPRPMIPRSPSAYPDFPPHPQYYNQKMPSGVDGISPNGNGPRLQTRFHPPPRPLLRPIHPYNVYEHNYPPHQNFNNNIPPHVGGYSNGVADPGYMNNQDQNQNFPPTQPLIPNMRPHVPQSASSPHIRPFSINGLAPQPQYSNSGAPKIQTSANSLVMQQPQQHQAPAQAPGYRNPPHINPEDNSPAMVSKFAFGAPQRPNPQNPWNPVSRPQLHIVNQQHPQPQTSQQPAQGSGPSPDSNGANGANNTNVNVNYAPPSPRNAQKPAMGQNISLPTTAINPSNPNPNFNNQYTSNAISAPSSASHNPMMPPPPSFSIPPRLRSPYQNSFANSAENLQSQMIGNKSMPSFQQPRPQMQFPFSDYRQPRTNAHNTYQFRPTQRSSTMAPVSHYNKTAVSPVKSNSMRVSKPSSDVITGQQPHFKNQVSAVYTASHKTPIVNPALLSKVATELRRRIVLGDCIKDGLTYKDAFSGKDAVDVISFIIKTNDRNLALLLGRALDAQKFLHDVTYDHRLRDSSAEIYKFSDSLRNTIIDTYTQPEESEVNIHAEETSENHPNGIFTLVTECYSPTCTRDKLCYSIGCPRRLEQQARLNMKPQAVLKRENSRSTLNGLDDSEKTEKLWINNVPKEVSEKLDHKEKKRQEIIFEIVYTEKDFVKDLEYLRDYWIKRLKFSQIIPPHRRDQFIKMVFGNVLEIYSVNSQLSEALIHRQLRNHVVYHIADIIFEFAPYFEPFVSYGASQLLGRYELEKEKTSNTMFARFVEETERLPESRKLELNGYLTKPTTRLARYPLLLESLLRVTEPNNPDYTDIPKAVKLIRDILQRVNVETGKAETRFTLLKINQQLSFKSGEYFDLNLLEEGRELIFRGNLKKRGTAAYGADSSADIHLMLFDHALLPVKVKMVAKRESYRVYKKPIPLELLVLVQFEDSNTKDALTKRPSTSLIPGATKVNMDPLSNNKGYAMTFIHLGRRGYSLTLYATTYVIRKKWFEHIEAQQQAIKKRSLIFQNILINSEFFVAGKRLTCCAAFDGGRKLVFGTENGVYVSDRKSHTSIETTPERVLVINNVTQVDVIEEYSIMLVLADKTLYSYAIEPRDWEEKNISTKRGKKVSNHTSFFKTGVCSGRILVCVVKSSVLNTTIKVMEPVESLANIRRKPAFKKLLASGHDSLKTVKELYMPTESVSIHFLRKKLCVGCTKGFEIVSLDTLETQSLLDPADTSLEFVEKRDNIKPIAIFRLNGEFLVCYSDFAIYVNKDGWRAKGDWIINWEGVPQSFAMSYPYIFAFEPSFIEIRHVETAEMVQVIAGTNIQLLTDGRGYIGEGGEILYACDEKSRISNINCTKIYALIPNEINKEKVPLSEPKTESRAS